MVEIKCSNIATMNRIHTILHWALEQYNKRYFDTRDRQDIIDRLQNNLFIKTANHPNAEVIILARQYICSKYVVCPVCIVAIYMR